MRNETETEESPPAAAPRRGFLRRNAGVLVMAALLVIVTTVAGLTWAGQQSVLAQQKADIDDSQGRLASFAEQQTQQLDEDVLTALGFSRDRLGTDEGLIDQLLDAAFTWDSAASYDAARDRIEERFGFAEDDPFMTQFMPPARFSQDADGKRYYYIDTQGLNSAIGDDPDIEVIGVQAGKYQYAATVDVSVTDDTAKPGGANATRASANRVMLLFLTVDTDGTISDISGAPPSGATRQSG